MALIGVNKNYKMLQDFGIWYGVTYTIVYIYLGIFYVCIFHFLVIVHSQLFIIHCG